MPQNSWKFLGIMGAQPRKCGAIAQHATLICGKNRLLTDEEETFSMLTRGVLQ